MSKPIKPKAILDPSRYKGEKPEDIGRRLNGIHPRVNVAEGQSVTVWGVEYTGTGNGYAEIADPKWSYVEKEDREALRARIEINGKPIGFQWLVHEEDKCEHALSGCDIKVDGAGRVYCLAHYPSLEGHIRCINCDGLIICGINPRCPPTVG